MIFVKILYFYCGEGLGHTTRVIAAGKALEREHEVVYASYGYAKTFAEQSGLNVEECPGELELSGKNGQFDISKSILTTIKKTKPLNLIKYNRLINKHKPDLVLSDSFFAPAYLAKQKHIPTWMLLNQTNISQFFNASQRTSVHMIGGLVRRVNFSTLEKMDKVLVTDFAPPYTVCRDSLYFTPKLYERTEYIGPLVRKQGYELPQKKATKTVHSTIGGFGYRAQLLNKIIEVSKNMPDYKFNIVAGPNAKIETHNKNVKTYGSVLDQISLMNEASVIINGGGHSAMMESVCLGKPILSAPDAFHTEQEGNANGIQRLGIGYRIEYKTPTSLLETLIRELSESKEIHKKSKHLQKLAEKNDGRKEIVKLAKEFSQTL